MQTILYVVARTNARICILLLFFSVKDKSILSKFLTKSTTLFHEEAIAYIQNWIEVEDNEDDDMLLVENNDDDDSCSDLYESDIVQSDHEDVEIRRPSKKLLTKNRLVHNIDSSLNGGCYDEIHFMNRKEQWETLTSYVGSNTNKKQKTDYLDQWFSNTRQAESLWYYKHWRQSWYYFGCS